MNIYDICVSSNSGINFKGKRVNRNLVAQLAQNNPYSLTPVNQRLIKNAIDELAHQKGEKNVNFLLQIAQNVKYIINSTKDNLLQNNWVALLLNAAKASALLTGGAILKSTNDKINEIKEGFNNSIENQEISHASDILLSRINLKQIKNETNGTIKNFEKNLKYFIASSETTSEHKKYVLKKLNYFMSDKYKINEQLKDKKSIVVAEMINDMVISVPDEKIPNIKAINQKHHGMCAAISIVRKKLAYEDKPNYVNAILSELDSSDSIMVYDRSKLGSGIKIPVKKVQVDFKTALAQGYRIIDASTMHWMQIAQMNGENNEFCVDYHPFDKKNFDVNTDTMFNINVENNELKSLQKAYQAMLKAKDIIEDYKALKIKKSLISTEKYAYSKKNVKEISEISNALYKNLINLDQNLTSKKSRELLLGLLELEKNSSSDINKNDRFSYIKNEEEKVKKDKIKNYLINNSEIKELSSKNLDKIYELVEYNNSILAKTKSISKGIDTQARTLYEIAAAFRLQLQHYLEDSQLVQEKIKLSDCPNYENMILNTLDDTISLLKNKSSDKKVLLESLNQSLKNIKLKINKNDLINNDLKAFINNIKETDNIDLQIKQLNELKSCINEVLTDGFDKIYQSFGIENKNEGLISCIKGLKFFIQNGDKDKINTYAELLGTKNYSKDVYNALNKLEKQLTNKPKSYDEIFKKLGYISQLEYLNALYNNIKDDANSDNVSEELHNYNEFLTIISNNLKLLDKNGDVILSATPAEFIMKKYEKDGLVVSSQDLRELQNYFENLDNIESQDEFNFNKKTKNKNLPKLSKHQIQLLKDIDKSINPMHSYLKKEFAFTRDMLRNVLEEISRQIGVNNGEYWVSEGSSGLRSEQEIRILEYITGRPHFMTENLEAAIKNMKKSPYSGITSSSVFHNRYGMHAQYVSDIEPIKIKTKNEVGEIKEETKEVMFHDNTWGAREKDNVWIDFNGQLRTDYSDNRGGTLGYITNDKYQNGNLVERVLDDMTVETEPNAIDNKYYKKLKGLKNDSISRSKQYKDTILAGYSPEAGNNAKIIKQLLFSSPMIDINLLEKFASNFSEKELDSKIKSYNIKDISWEKKFSQILNYIYETKITQEEFDKLANDNPLKLALEKVATKINYKLLNGEDKLVKVKSVEELNNIVKSQKQLATRQFKYAFSKDKTISKYAFEEFLVRDKDIKNMFKRAGYFKNSSKNKNSIEENSILINEKDFQIKFNEFNGSLKHSIDLIMANLNKKVDALIKNKEKNATLKIGLKKLLEKVLYFSETDINKPENANLVSFIDRVYDPVDNKEFVNIYKDIQNMTTEEFKNNVLNKVKPEDFGFKNLSGYQVLQKIKKYDNNLINSLMNTIYFDNKLAEVDKNSIFVKYENSKFQRTPVTYEKKNLENIYNSYKNTLSTLMFPQLMKNAKIQQVPDKEIYPAYPSINFVPNDFIKEQIENFINTSSDIVKKINFISLQAESYKVNYNLLKYAKILDEEKALTSNQCHNLKNNLLKLLVLSDTGLYPNLVNKINETINLLENDNWTKKLPKLNEIVLEISNYENLTSTYELMQTKQMMIEEFNSRMKTFIDANIRNSAKNKIGALLKELKQALLKDDNEAIEVAQNKLLELAIKENLYAHPQDLLDTYIKSCAKDSKLHPYSGLFKDKLNYLMQMSTYAEMQMIIMDAISSGVEASIKNEFKNLKLDLVNGDKITMDSGEALFTMVNKLLSENHDYTALFFMEKLGLSEDYVDFVSKNIDYNLIKSNISKAGKLINNYNKFVAQVKELIINVKKDMAENNLSAQKALSNLKSAILQIALANKIDDDVVKLLVRSINYTKNLMKNESDYVFDSVFQSIFTNTFNETVQIIEDDINTLLQPYNSLITMINMIAKMHFKEDSTGYKTKKLLLDRFKNLDEFQSKRIRNLQAC